PRTSAPTSTSATAGSPPIATRSMRRASGCRPTISTFAITTPSSTAATPRPSASTTPAGTATEPRTREGNRGGSAMAQSFPGMTHARFWAVGIAFIVLMVLVHVAAQLLGAADAGALAAGRPGHTATYYQVVFSIWATILLLTPALCFHIFS